ncbi:alpha-ketoglutarate-dependent dioxygenase AlkB family protein [Maribacter spongiicola]|uniref:alpha-ketoglutarate-dependent dioxygenase AlkB family protein n=1 Tax=Maribacter spongiicola TaxID=1206753 RepID=UPI003F94874E
MDVFNQRDLFSTDEVRKTEFDFPGADIFLFENFCSNEESDRLYTSLLNNTNREQDQLLIYDKEIDLSRLTAWHGDTDADESYAHTKSKVLPWTEGLLFIKKRIEQKVDVKFILCLLNYYRDGEDSVNWHRDYTGEKWKNTVIGSVTFGATRSFQLKHATRKDLKRVDIPLAHGSLLIMQGATQEN